MTIELLPELLAAKLQEKGVIIPPTQEEAESACYEYSPEPEEDYQYCNKDYTLDEVYRMQRAGFLAGYAFAITPRS